MYEVNIYTVVDLDDDNAVVCSFVKPESAQAFVDANSGSNYSIVPTVLKEASLL